MATRRDVLKSGTLAAAAIALPLPSWAGSLGAGAAAGAPPLSRSGLAPLVGGRLLAESPTGQRLELILLEVKDTPTASLAQASNRDDCFMAVFEGPKPGLQQGTYRIDSPATGDMEMFLVPGPCPDPDRCYLIATINRLIR